MAKRVSKGRKDTTPYDSQWKLAITELSRPFMELFFPDIAAEIDWRREWEPLDKELRPEKTGDTVGVREADLLFRVHRNDGEANWVVIHIEFQAQEQTPMVLAERVWVYFTRIRQRYGKKVCSLAILGDLEKSCVTPSFQEALWGCRVQLDFPVAQLLMMERRLDAEPELAHNPFSWIVRLHLAAKRSNPTGAKRRIYKRIYLQSLFRAMEGGRLSAADERTIRTIHVFYDTILSLSVENDKLFREELENDEEIQLMIKQKKQPLLTMFERWALEDERQRHQEELQQTKKELEQELEQERRRAEQERQRAEQLEARLRALGLDPN